MSDEAISNKYNKDCFAFDKKAIEIHGCQRLAMTPRQRIAKKMVLEATNNRLGVLD